MLYFRAIPESVTQTGLHMPETTVLRKFFKKNHRHTTCVSHALKSAEQACLDRGIRLTPIRRRVLELIWDSHEPVKAYDLLQKLQNEIRHAAPPTVYRALNFLLDEGLVHKLQSLNAYVGCGQPGHINSGQFLICNGCGEIAELYDSRLVNLISKNATSVGFEIENQVIEIRGSCSNCKTC